jgi:hypothetical protein
VYLVIVLHVAGCSSKALKDIGDAVDSYQKDFQKRYEKALLEKKISRFGGKAIKSFSDIPESDKIGKFIRNKEDFVSAINLLLSMQIGEKLTNDQSAFIERAIQINKGIEILNKYNRQKQFSYLYDNSFVVAFNENISGENIGLCNDDIDRCNIAFVQVIALGLVEAILFSFALYAIARAAGIMTDAAFKALDEAMKVLVAQYTQRVCPLLAAKGYVLGCSSVLMYSNPQSGGNQNSSGQPPNDQNGNQDPNKNGKTPPPYPKNPDNSGDFSRIKGSRAQRNNSDDSIWEKDFSQHGGSTWKRWPNQKSWERGDKPESVRNDGTVR